MGIQEKEIVELYREMLAERKGVNITIDGLAILTAARVLKRVMEKCTIEISGAIEQSRPEYELKLTLHQANAIIDMDNHGYSEGLCPEDERSCEGWGELLSLAETITGRTANGNLSDDQITARDDADYARKVARQDFGDMTPSGGGRMV